MPQCVPLPESPYLNPHQIQYATGARCGLFARLPFLEKPVFPLECPVVVVKAVVFFFLHWIQQPDLGTLTLKG